MKKYIIRSKYPFYYGIIMGLTQVGDGLIALLSLGLFCSGFTITFCRNYARWYFINKIKLNKDLDKNEKK